MDKISKTQPRGEGTNREILRRKLLHLVISGQLESGKRLKEEQLAKRLRVSRTPLREALIALERDGIVLAKPNIGFSVAPLSRTEAEELYPIVGELEALRLELCFERARTLSDKLTDINEQFLRARKNPEKARALDRQFHSVLLGSATNETLNDLLESLQLKLARYEARYMAEEGLVQASYQQHKEILSALRKGAKDRATRALKENWRYGMHAFLARENGD